MLLAVKHCQVFSLKLPDAVLGGDRAADGYRPANETAVDLPGPRRFVTIARENVHVHMVVPDVTEDCVTQISIAQRVLIKPQHSGKRFIGYGHIGGNLA